MGECITADDYLIISLGGNDIALRPNLCTILNVLTLVNCTTTDCIEKRACGSSIPIDECCCGFTTSCCSNALAFPFGYGYMIHLFKTRLEKIAVNILSKRKVIPKKVLICMVYYLDEKPGGSWAEMALSGLGYNKNPRHLQTVIKLLFRDATSKISIPGVSVQAVPLFESLDGSDTSDYCARVEPSAKGGEKMGKQLLDYILDEANRSNETQNIHKNPIKYS